MLIKLRMLRKTELTVSTNRLTFTQKALLVIGGNLTKLEINIYKSGSPVIEHHQSRKLAITHKMPYKVIPLNGTMLHDTLDIKD